MKPYRPHHPHCAPHGSRDHGNALFLEGVTVCVNYADFLDVTLTHNLAHFDEFVVVTSHGDRQTQLVCAKHSVTCIETDVFHERRGDAFNKGSPSISASPICATRAGSCTSTATSSCPTAFARCSTRRASRSTASTARIA